MKRRGVPNHQLRHLIPVPHHLEVIRTVFRSRSKVPAPISEVQSRRHIALDRKISIVFIS